MSTYQRIFLIIIDSFGIGEAEDAAAFGDAGADTLGHIAQHHMPLRASHIFAGLVLCSCVRCRSCDQQARRSDAPRA